MSAIFTRLFVYFFVFNVTVFFPKMNAMMLLMTIINNNKDKILFLPLVEPIYVDELILLLLLLLMLKNDGAYFSNYLIRHLIF